MRAASTPGAGEHAAPPRALARWQGWAPTVAQLARYAAVAGVATALNAALFLLLRPWLDAVPANLVALTLTTAVSTEANRHVAFGGARAHKLREWVQDVGTVAFYACYTTVVLVTLTWVDPAVTPAQEATAVALASVAGGLLRYAVLRFWVFESGPEEARDECSTTSRPST